MKARPFTLIVLAIAGCTVSVYLAAFELGRIGEVWDPLFGEGSRRVLTSWIARVLPVPDAVFGAIAYGVDAVLAALVAAGVWRSDLVAVALAVVATAGGVVGVLLALSQATLLGSFCTLCLLSSGISVALALGALVEARERVATRMNVLQEVSR